MQHQEESYYARYCRMGRRLEIIGGAVLAAALLLGVITGGLRSPAVLLAGGAGALLLIFGASSMRPNNQIKSFAMQLGATLDRDFAQGLLEAMTANGKTALAGRSRTVLDDAITSYAASEGADAELAEALRQAREKHIRSVIF